MLFSTLCCLLAHGTLLPLGWVDGSWDQGNVIIASVRVRNDVQGIARYDLGAGTCDLSYLPGGQVPKNIGGENWTPTYISCDKPSLPPSWGHETKDAFSEPVESGLYISKSDSSLYTHFLQPGGPIVGEQDSFRLNMPGAPLDGLISATNCESSGIHDYTVNKKGTELLVCGAQQFTTWARYRNDQIEIKNIDTGYLSAIGWIEPGKSFVAVNGKFFTLIEAFTLPEGKGVPIFIHPSIQEHVPTKPHPAVQDFRPTGHIHSQERLSRALVFGVCPGWPDIPAVLIIKSATDVQLVRFETRQATLSKVLTGN